MVTFESHFRSGLVQTFCRAETSAAIVNRFLVATFIMHERCLPTGPDQDISSAFPRYCNGGGFSCDFIAWRHLLRVKNVCLNLAKSLRRCHVIKNAWERDSRARTFFVLNHIYLFTALRVSFTRVEAKYRTHAAIEGGTKGKRDSVRELRAFGVTPLPVGVNICRLYAKPVPMAVGWANSANWIYLYTYIYTCTYTIARRWIIEESSSGAYVSAVIW